MRVTYDPAANAVYIYLTDDQLEPGRDTITVASPRGVFGGVNIDWKDGKLVGVEILGALSVLHQDLLDQAER